MHVRRGSVDVHRVVLLRVRARALIILLFSLCTLSKGGNRAPERFKGGCAILRGIFTVGNFGVKTNEDVVFTMSSCGLHCTHMSSFNLQCI